MEKESLPRVTVVITTFNNEQTIEECLKSVFDLNYPKNLLEVIIVDGGSKDSTVKKAEKYPAKVIVKPSTAPAAYNYALSIASSDLVAILDADVKVEKDWLNKLVKHFEDPKVAGASGWIETWNGENPLPRSIGYDIKYRYSRLLKENKIRRLATMNLLLRKDVLEKVGGFDESLPTQYDTDLGNRITDEGYRLVLDPKAKCYHFHRHTWREYFKQQLRYGKNTLRLYLRKPKLIKGDKITDFGMNIQPILLVTAFASAILGLALEPARLIMLYISTFIMTFLLIYYMICAVKVSIHFKDATAMVLVAIYIVRAVAWTLGGCAAVLKALKEYRRKDGIG